MASNFTQQLRQLSEGYPYDPVRMGTSGAAVYHVHSQPIRYIKVTRRYARPSAKDECERLRWLRGRVPTPPLIAYREDDTHQYLMTEALCGTLVYDDTLDWSPERIMQTLARAARQFHDAPAADCPFIWDAGAQIEQAQQNVQRGRINAERMTPELSKYTPADILQEALSLHQPATADDLTLIHGDMYPINILIERDSGAVSGFIDVGRAGVGDRYADLALIVNTIRWHLDERYVPLFFEAYGLANVDQDKLRCYQLLNVLL